VGLGLNLGSAKRLKTSASPELHKLKGLAGEASPSSASSRALQRVSPKGESKERWPRDRWREAFDKYVI
jgi:hypothetical protein